MSFHLDIITPAGKVYEDQVESLQAAGLEGGFEVYTGHQPMLIALKEGALRVRKDGKENIFKCASGILEINTEHQVMVLVDAAVPN